MRTIEEKFGVRVPFPVIADLDMKVSSLYGMVHPGAATTQTVRAVFIIDDKGLMRAMVYYPLSNGRNIPEVLRILKALQTSDEHGVATPANWQPGDQVIVPPPATTEEADRRVRDKSVECTDWFFCKRSL